MPSPLTSEKPPTICPSSPEPWSPPSATRKLKAPYGVSSRRTAIGCLLSSASRRRSTGRCGRSRTRPASSGRHADQADQPAVVEVVLGHRRPVAADEVRLLRLRPEQRPGPPLDEQEVLDRLSGCSPRAARCSARTPPTACDLSIECSRKMNRRRTFTYFHSGSEVIVRAPQTRLPRPGKKRSALIPSGLSTSCRPLLMFASNRRQARDDLVRRRLEHAALDVAARVDAGDEARRRQHAAAAAAPLRGPLGRVEDLDPGVVERRRRWCRTAPRNSRTSEIELFRIPSTIAIRYAFAASAWRISACAGGEAAVLVALVGARRPGGRRWRCPRPPRARTGRWP